MAKRSRSRIGRPYKYTKRRRNNRRRSIRIARMYSRPSVHYFKQTILTAKLSSTGNFSGGYSFMLDDLGTAFVNPLKELFDQYKLCRIKMRFYYSSTSWDINSTNLQGRCAIVYDQNGIFNPTSLQSMMDYKTCRLIPMGRLQGKGAASMYIVPYQQTMTYASAIKTSYFASRPKWNNFSDSTDVKHYGIMFYAESNSQTASELAIYTTYYIKCKHQR